MRNKNNTDKAKIFPPIKKYVNSIERRLNLPLNLRARVMNDFSTSICARNEQGESYEDIMKSLGSPDKVAAELNEQLKDFTYRKSPWRFACLLLALCSLMWIIFWGLMPWISTFMSSIASESIIGGADGPTSIFVTKANIVTWREILVCLVLTALGIFGFVRLSHCKNKRY